MPYKDPTIRQAYQKAYQSKWRASHPTYKAEWHSRRRQSDPDYLKQYHREYKQTNKNTINRRRREHYKLNADPLRAKQKTIHQRRRAYLNAVKCRYGCMNPDCPCTGPLPPYCLDFHHVDPKSKLFSIGAALRTMAAIKREVVKCTVLCAVCHRMETWGNLDASQFRLCTA